MYYKNKMEKASIQTQFLLVFLATTLATIAASYIIFMLKQKTNHVSTKENFCQCHGMDKKVCPSNDVQKALYNAGILTEFTPLKKSPKWQVLGEFEQCYAY